jgi:protein-S-isoprenylcysteine O-methyltransferase Ste14
MQALGWNRQDDMYHSATLAQNLTQLFDNVGGIGKEILDRQQQQALVDSGVYGIMNDPMLANLLENYFKKKNKKGE